jgi:hypothetical protein
MQRLALQGVAAVGTRRNLQLLVIVIEFIDTRLAVATLRQRRAYC